MDARNLLVAASLTLALTARADVYVSPAGSGNKDGTSAADAYDVTQLQTACTEAGSAEEKTVRLAGGVYYTTEDEGITVPEGVSVIGSSDEADPTILCGDVNKDDVWDRFSIEDYWTAATNNLKYARAATAEPVLKDGKINLPSDAASVMYFARTETRTDNRKRCLYLKGKVARSIENLTITGYGIGYDAGCKSGCILYVEGLNTTLRKVKAIANHVGDGGIYTAVKTCLRDCDISYNEVSHRGAYQLRAADEIYDCRFVSNYKIGGNSGTAIYYGGYSASIVSNCWFEMNECGGTVYAPSPCISVENGGHNSLVVDCTFTNNLSISFAPTCINCGGFGWRILNCRMVGNSQVFSSNNDSLLVGCVAASGTGNPAVLDGCTFANNRSCCYSTGDTAKTVAASPYHVFHCAYNGWTRTSTGSPRGEVVNCLFYDNTFALNGNTNNATLCASRAVGFYGWSTEGSISLGVANCTFAGRSALPDIAIGSVCATKVDSVVVNSVFSGPVSPDYRPVLALADQPLLFVSNTTAGVFSYPTSVTAEGTATDDPLVVLPRGEMSARTEGMRETCPVSWFEDGTVRYVVYEYGGEAQHLDPILTTTIPAASKRTYVGDIAKAARPTDGTALRGARETTDAATASKKTVVYRVSPTGTATLNGRTGLTELSDGGTSTTAFTFVKSSDQIAFEAWKDTAGNILSTDIDWKPTVGSDDVTVVAVFSAPKIKYAFDLGESGTFDANGKSVITNEYTTGDTPSIPAYTFDSEHYVSYGWDRDLPLAVGTENLDFKMRYLERKYRILRYDTNVAPGGTGDGSTWANAMTNLDEALELAMISGGEIRVKKGEHRPCRTQDQTFATASGVSLLGGFDGETYASDAAELAARDPVANETVISGYLPGSTSQKAATFLSVADGDVDETCVVDGFTLRDFTSNTGWIVWGTHVHPTTRNCRFIGSGSASSCYTTSWSTFENCVFSNLMFGVYVAETGPWTQHAVFRDCLFTHCTTTGRGALAQQGGQVELHRCTFRCNKSQSSSSGGAAAIGAENGYVWVWDSLFEDNEATANGGNILRRTYVLSNCVVRCNRSKSGIILDAPLAGMRIVDSSFYSNEVAKVSTAESGTVSAAIVSMSHNEQMILNATFADNVVTGSTAGAVKSFGTIQFSGHVYGAIAWSTFANNVADADFVENARNQWTSIYLVGDVAWSDAPEYCAYKVAVAPTSSGRINVYDSTLGNLAETPATFQTVVGLKTDDPVFRKRVFASDGHIRLPLSPSSPSARSSRGVYATANGSYAFNKAEKGGTEDWCSLLSQSMTKPYTLVPDATGASRRDWRSSRGALEAGPAPTVILVR